MKKFAPALDQSSENIPSLKPTPEGLSPRFSFFVNFVLIGFGLQLFQTECLAVVSNLTNIDPTQEFATLKTPRFQVTFPRDVKKSLNWSASTTKKLRMFWDRGSIGSL
jgi:hypothetical protein